MAFQEYTPEDWRDEIENGLEYRRRFGLEDMWGVFESIYYNVHESMMNDGPNLFLSQGDAMLSTLTVPTPKVLVKATTPEAVDKAPLVESLDNVLIEDMELTDEVETAILHAWLFGRGIIKVGYDSEWGYDPRYDVGGSLKLGLSLTQLDRKGKRAIEYDANVVPGMPWARAVPPHDIVLPWGAKDIRNTPWIAHRVCRHIDDIKADPKYQNTKDLQPQLSMEDFVNSYRSAIKVPGRYQNVRSFGKRSLDYVEFYEIHDRRTGKIFAITWDSERFLRNQDNALQIENQLPFTSVAFTPRTRSFWTTPDVAYLFHIQNEVSDVAVQRTKQRRISTIKFLYDSGAVSDEELLKILSPEVGAAVKVESGHDITKAVTKLENNPNQTLIQEEELLRANAREQIGFSRNQLGEYTGGRKTAREVATVDRASQLRMSRRGVQTKKLYEHSIQLINNIVFTQWTIPRVVRVMGKQQGEMWLKLNGPQLRSRYNYRVEFVDDQESQSEAMQALQLYGFLAQDPAVDPVGLREYLINKVNNPAFARIFSQDVRGEMAKRALIAANGGIQPTNQNPQALAQMFGNRNIAENTNAIPLLNGAH